MSLRVLIIGGYGIFGARLARLLAADARLHLIIAGRSIVKARALIETLPAGAGREAAAFDRDGDPSNMATLAPAVVVDAAGPFQAYGNDPYRIVRAAIAVRAHYVDLADAAAFVGGIGALDVESRAAEVCVASGASTYSALSGAVVRRLSDGLETVTAIRSGVAPSPFAGVGLNVVRAISSYAGKPLGPPLRGRVRRGIVDSLRHTISPPGVLPLRRLRFSLADTPDLADPASLFDDPARAQGLHEVITGAGPQPPILHGLLSALARLVSWGLLPSLSPFSGLFHWGSETFRWGEHRGGMFVEVEGVRTDGRRVRRNWDLAAEGDDGPFVPAIAAAAFVRAVADGRPPKAGARGAGRSFDLGDYQPVFDTLAIRHGVRTEDDAAGPLYRQVLGEAWGRLSPPVRALHDQTADSLFRGRAAVERGKGPLAALVAALMGLPRAAADVPVEVRFSLKDGGELWRRTFDGRSFQSFQTLGRGAEESLVVERFGPVKAGLAITEENGRLRVTMRRASVLGVPLPRFLWPGCGDTFEHDADGRFNFHVEIEAPLAGLVVRYRGWLEQV